MTEIKIFLQYTILGLEFNCNCEAVSTMSSTCVNESDAIFVIYDGVSKGKKVVCNLLNFNKLLIILCKYKSH